MRFALEGRPHGAADIADEDEAARRPAGFNVGQRIVVAERKAAAEREAERCQMGGKVIKERAGGSWHDK